jgi:formate/nitrite transporter FocA (FNT family)
VRLVRSVWAGGNTLIVMTWASGKVSSGLVLRNWSIVYFGNLVVRSRRSP